MLLYQKHRKEWEKSVKDQIRLKQKQKKRKPKKKGKEGNVSDSNHAVPWPANCFIWSLKKEETSLQANA